MSHCSSITLPQTHMCYVFVLLKNSLTHSLNHSPSNSYVLCVCAPKELTHQLSNSLTHSLTHLAGGKGDSLVPSSTSTRLAMTDAEIDERTKRFVGELPFSLSVCFFVSFSVCLCLSLSGSSSVSLSLYSTHSLTLTLTLTLTLNGSRKSALKEI